ncbi:MAG: class I SAM-dependent methyltransferase [Cyanobacteriota bacterium]
MTEKILKILFDCIDYFLAHQVASKMGYGHQIDSRKRLDKNTRFIHETFDHLGNNLKVLEMASGRGVLAQEIIQKPNVEFYLACDIDPNGIKVLEKRLKRDKNASKIKTKIANTIKDELNFENYFDVVIADKLLHLLSPEEIEIAFMKANKLLKPGGYFLINSASVNNFVFERTEAENETDLYRKLKSDTLTRLWYNIEIPYVFFITCEYIQQISEKTGFLYHPDHVCPRDEDYLTVTLCRKSS